MLEDWINEESLLGLLTGQEISVCTGDRVKKLVEDKRITGVGHEVDSVLDEASEGIIAIEKERLILEESHCLLVGELVSKSVVDKEDDRGASGSLTGDYNRGRKKLKSILEVLVVDELVEEFFVVLLDVVLDDLSIEDELVSINRSKLGRIEWNVSNLKGRSISLLEGWNATNVTAKEVKIMSREEKNNYI